MAAIRCKECKRYIAPSLAKEGCPVCAHGKATSRVLAEIRRLKGGFHAVA